jgi:glutaredoxin
VAYSKVGDTQYVRDASADRVSEDANGAWKWLLILVVVAAVAWQGKFLWKRPPTPSAGEQSVQSQAQPEIVFYSASWCGYCDATRTFFKDNGIRYTEHDIEKTAEGAAGYKSLGGGGVPLMVIGDETIRGYSEPGLRQVLGPWLRRS